MSKEDIYSGLQKLKFNKNTVSGEFVSIDGDIYYKISDYDNMDSFLVSIVSASDHWMYISSRGGLTAGRRNPDNALFPYVNDNELHDCAEITGSKTLLKLREKNQVFLWEPFSELYYGIYDVTRNLYKNIYGTKIVFEEINTDLKLTFRYSWSVSDNFGIVKSSELINATDNNRNIEVLDGIQNILPSGINQQIQTEFSTLVDGYKKNELISESGLGLFTLSSIPSDSAQPSESLNATTVCSIGLTAENILLSSVQLNKFRQNKLLEPEISTKGIRGSYFINSNFSIKPENSLKWYFIAEVNQNTGSVVKLNEALRQKHFQSVLLKDIEQSNFRLKKIVANADGLQLSGDRLSAVRHFSNVLFNVMRGGVFDDSYFVYKKDFIAFIKNANPFVFNAHEEYLQDLPDKILHSDLVSQVKKFHDSHFYRLAVEYLPLTFSRRHGDPSRPWNRFSIEIKNEKNEKVLNYQGNWRDIFQNWEALALSYPKFLESMIAKFLNTSTADGYNPYRIFRDGFDWEIQEPHNPWANLGYWGDHQIIYLLKLLELSREYNPGSLESFIDQQIFTYANVPYRIKEYQEILKDPRSTIEFDAELDYALKEEERLYGTDTKYLKRHDKTLIQVNLIEKLLLTLVVKMSNFIPGGGIWMNTQRPEWNDAKNALVGNGISMVTLFYIRRYLNFLKIFLNDVELNSFNVSVDIIKYFEEINNIFVELRDIQQESLSSRERKNIVDRLGKTGSSYRDKLYKSGFNTTTGKISKEKIIDFADSCLVVIDRTISLNKRNDRLYHSYNILHISENEMKISNLYEMLEGQVAVLSSGYLSTQESIDLLDALESSSLYRKDQNSYLLYPDKKLPSFLEKNNIPESSTRKSELFQMLLSAGNEEIIYKDLAGRIHFQSDIINAERLRKKLSSLSDPLLKQYVEKDSKLILEIYEDTFRHSEFTGRANTFYKYEGLGSIYWHMVSKLLLAVQEVFIRAERESAKDNKLNRLRELYYEIKAGIGTHKSPSDFGAFPTDPYSHTPAFAGAQQPGMTGQVKEDIIARFRELGIRIDSGRITFNPSLLNKADFLTEKETFESFDLDGNEQKVNCEKHSFAFTYCQVPFVVRIVGHTKIIVYKSDGDQIEFDELAIESDLSQSIFNRDGKISKVEILLDT